MSSVLHRPSVRIAAVTAAAALALAACASNSDDTGSGPTGTVTNSVSKQQSLASLVPAKIKSAGKLIVGVNVPYAPNEYVQNGKVVGFDVDLMNATAKVLGLTAVYRQADFDKIVPAVKAGTYDIGMSSFTDTKLREKTDDFVDYFSAGILWASPKGKTVDPNNACGLTVAVQSNTTEQQDQLPALSKACTKAGKKAIRILPFDSQDDATNAVVLGKADAMSADSPITAYAIKQTGGKLQQAGKITEAEPYGWPIAKGSSLVQAMQKALQSLIKDGTYAAICQKWGVQSGEIKTSTVNGATS
ncbi:ABC transporter substrate-binding protein [Jatrophihabitans endophyticus]|uniref:ABC transporter substrate-binding protein n=1 Tax=Jatrophihabitans endophyticus TaxID=1206085 RepID=UPI0019F83517|nr:ABC transporter substrate-binding protein [Jatrophihabitans endophyticus]MBE7187682.1 ABC transporter substrate-binding protein [Jatrophihabitans endophyticus]